MQKLAAGIDIGGTNTRVGLVNEKGKILAKASVSTKDFQDPKNFVTVVSNKISELRTPGSKLTGIGIGAPNGNFFRGTIEFAPNLDWKGVIPMAKYFSQAMKCRSILTNDAKAAALGEKLFGGAKKMNDFIFITLGTGLGSGIVANGALVYGQDGFAGELGHVTIEKNGRLCGCGRHGCLEQYCSATGIIKTYLEKNPNAGKSIDSRFIFERARAGEKEALDAFNYTGDVLGAALANSVAYTRPEAIFLFGGLAQSGKLIFEPTIRSFENNLLGIYRNKVKILPSKLPEDDAAILGAASLIFASAK